MDSVMIGFMMICCTALFDLTTSQETTITNSTIIQCPEMCTCSLKEFMIVHCEIRNDDFNVGDALDMVITSMSSFGSNGTPTNISLYCKESETIHWYSATLLHSVVSLRVTNCQVDTKGSVLVFSKSFKLKCLHFKGMNPSFFNNIDLRDLRGIQKLDIEKCNLTSVPELLIPKDTSQLARLAFRFNKLTEIECKLVSDYKCKAKKCTIDVDNNKISNVPQCICGNNTFYELKLRYNRIKDIKGLECIKQKHIDFSGNEVENIPYFKYDSAITFYATFNNIKVIKKESFMHLVNCQTVVLSYNNVEWIEDGAFQTLRNLRILYLDSNKIKHFEVTHAPTTTMFECNIYLRNNALEYPPFKNDNYKPTQLFKTAASDNPFICDCEAKRFQDYFLNSGRIIVKPEIMFRTSYSSIREIFIDARLYRCALPQYTSGQYLLKKNMTNECPEVANCPVQCVCTRDLSTDEVFVNCSSRNLTKIPNKLPNSKLVIDLSNNFIKVLNKRDFMIRTLRLNISYNLLEVVKPDVVPLLNKLLSLDLRHNHISNLPGVFKEIPFIKTAIVFLSFNEYKCSCEMLWMSKWLVAMGNAIVDGDQLFCRDIKRDEAYLIRDLNEHDFSCKPILNKHEKLATGLGIMAFLLLVVILLSFHFRSELRVLFYVKIQLRFFLQEVECKQFDAFISYSEHDREFVTNLVNKLENERPLPYTICIHDRDFAIGLPIAENISSAINRSRVVIFLVSNHFVDSNWCTFEFQTSYQTMVMEKNLKLIVIKHMDVDIAKLDDDLRAYFRTNSIIDTAEPLFWEKLLYALPHPAT